MDADYEYALNPYQALHQALHQARQQRMSGTAGFILMHRINPMIKGVWALEMFGYFHFDFTQKVSHRFWRTRQSTCKKLLKKLLKLDTWRTFLFHLNGDRLKIENVGTLLLN